MNTDFNILVKKIDAFRKKYFLYQFIRGLLLFAVILIILFIVLNLLEYKLFMPSEWRRVLFISSVVFIGLVFIRYVLFNLLQWSGVVRSLSDRRASEIIHDRVPGVKDRIINILELHENPDILYSGDIARAAIKQKMEELRIFNFSDAISMRSLKTLALYFLVSFVSVGTIHMINHSIFFESGNRLIRYNQQFVKPAPYIFIWENKVSGVEKGKNYTIKLKLEGDELPSVVYVNIGGNNYLMNPGKYGYFEYEMVSVINNIDFYFTDLKYLSQSFRLEIIPVPVINNFTADIRPPVYTRLDNTRLENVGDFQVPKGGLVKWTFEVFDTDSLLLIFNEKDTLLAVKESGNRFTTEKVINEPAVYEIIVKNNKTDYVSAMGFRIDIKEDSYPEILIAQVGDSTRMTRFYFRGTIHDDYGFSNLNFHLNVEMEDSAVTIPFNRYVMPQDFYYTVDLSDYQLKGKIVNYYFSVTDNDGINGPKTTTSESYRFVFPDRDELTVKQNEDYSKLENLIQESQEIADQLRNDLKDLQMKNLNSNISEWEKSRMAGEMLQKKEYLEQVLDEIEQTYKKMNNFQNTFSEQNEEIMKKQEQIQELLDNVLTDELKKLLEEFSKLAQEFDDKRLNQLSKQMDMTFDDLSKQLDRNLQMLKRMKIEQSLEDIVGQVGEMQKNQENLAIDIMENRDTDELQKKIIEEHQEVERIEKELEQIMDENEKLEKPLIFDRFKEEFNDIKEDIRKSLQEMQKNNRRNSSGNMQNSSEKSRNMAFSMQQMLNANTMEQNMENIQNLRQILKNLLVLSFEQENILQGIRTVGGRDPQLVVLTRKQMELTVLSQVVRDSLYSLASRAPQIGNVVNNELMAMSINLDRSSELMNEGLNSPATTHQQLVITATNNLALMLSEILQQIEDQMNNAQDGDGNPQPGQGGKQMGKLQQQSENLKDQLQRMIDQMKNGNQPLSREISESLMMHEMMQQMLREMMNSGTIGESARKQLQDIDRLLEQNRRDLMNRNVNQGMIRRQNEIITRLLEAERAEMERDQDNKRESNTADEQFYSNPAKLFNLDQERNISIENFQRDNLKLNNFYQSKFKNYIEKFNNDAP